MFPLIMDNTPKKRGRKSKKKEETPKVVKKRGRKPKNIIDNNLSNVDINNIYKPSNNSNLIKNNHILHLKLKSKDITLINNIFNKNNNHPVPYNSFISNNKECIKQSVINPNFFSINNELENKTKNFKSNYNNNFITHKVYNTFLSLNKIKDDEKWPLKTSICCMWCVHKFDNVPLGIPKRYINEKFESYGCFCSFNCAASFIFDKNNYTMWEEYNLLNLLYKKLYNKTIKIKLAPNRYILKIFGGVLTIEEFRRNFHQLDTNYILHEYPLISIISQIEKIKNKENDNSFIPINQNLFSQAENYKKENNNNLLENFMNLTIKK